MLSLIWAWTNGWANNQDAGDLRQHRAHYDVTVMKEHWCNCCKIDRERSMHFIVALLAQRKTFKIRWSSPRWRHQKGTFSALLAIWEGNSPANGEFPSQRPGTWSFEISFDPRLTNGWANHRGGWGSCLETLRPAFATGFQHMKQFARNW